MERRIAHYFIGPKKAGKQRVLCSCGAVYTRNVEIDAEIEQCGGCALKTKKAVHRDSRFLDNYQFRLRMAVQQLDRKVRGLR